MNPSATPPISPLFSAAGPQSRSSMSPLLITSVVFGLGTVIFGIMAMVYYNTATTTRNTATANLTQAVAAAKTDQKAADDNYYAQLMAAPFRSYIAPVAFGSFEIKFPKDWASYVVETTTGTQVNLQLNPEFVRKTDSADEPNGARVRLIEQTQAQFMNQYDQLVTQKKLKKTIITVSNLPGYSITGAFTDKKVVRMVVVPVRDKVIVFENENAKYANDFSDILAQSRIVP